MTEQEWKGVTRMLGEWWTSPAWDAQREPAWRVVLMAFDVAGVLEALRALRQQGRQFRPSVGEVEQIVLGVGLAEHATPEQAWALIEDAVRKVGRSVYAPDFHERHQAAVDWLAEQDRVVAAWAARRGLCGGGSLGSEPVVDADRGGAVRGMLTREYREQLERAQERVALGKPAVPADALYVRATGQLERAGGMRGLLDHLRPAQQLPASTTGEPVVEERG